MKREISCGDNPNACSVAESCVLNTAEVGLVGKLCFIHFLHENLIGDYG